MRRVLLPALAFALLATSALAQPPGGGRGGPPGGGPPPGGQGGGPGGAKQVDLEKVVIVGVVQAIDANADRVTIAYEASEPLNWPAGAMPFATAKPGMLGGMQVGQKVRFTLSNHRISAFLPSDAATPAGPPGAPPEGPPQGDRPPPPPR